MNQQPLPTKLDTLLFVDTETTGLPEDPAARTIEIACVWWHIERQCVLAAWSELVQHGSNEAENVNRIPRPVLSLGLSPDHAAQGFLSRVARADVLLAHRAEFDRQFVPKTDKPWVCTKFHFDWPYGAPGESLVPLAIANGVAVTHAHRALTDCMLMARLFESLSGPDTIRTRLINAMRPRKRYRAAVSFDQKDLAKDRGFMWKPETKEWLRDIADGDAKEFPFKVVEVKKDADDVNDGRRWHP